MDTTFNYTVKSGDGYLSIAKHIFNQSSRSYIQGLTKRYDLMKEVAEKIEADLKQQYFNFKLKAGLVLSLRSDPGHYIPRLAVTTSNASLQQKAVAKANSFSLNEHYFVIHSTAGNMDENKIARLKKSKPVGAGHAYITKQGELIELWPYNNTNGWATKVEKFKKPELRGKFVNIELIYAEKESPTEEQYQTLANVYIEAQKLFKQPLQIAAHREIDRGIPNGHEDPEGFLFDHFYKILREKAVKIDLIKRQSQERFDRMPWCQHAWTWPPILTGTSFKTLSKEDQINKGCKVN